MPESRAIPEPRTMAEPREAIDVLARTLYGEARGEGLAGIEAVAAVVMNRVARARANGGWWWGDDVVSVCRRRWQFSCWNPCDPNRARIEAAGPGDRVFDLCRRVARRAVAGRLADPTGGATHYHADHVFPAWARGRAPSAVIGRHLFYANVE